MWNRLVCHSLMALVLVAFFACDQQGQTDPQQPGEVAGSELERITEPSVSDSDLAQLAADNGDFAFALLAALGERDSNLFCSPHSVSVALAMLFAGARGETAAQMAQALHFGLEPSRLHPAFNALDLSLSSRADTVPPSGGDPFRLNVANQLWGQQGYQFLPPFLDLLAQHYGADLRLLDFETNPESARLAINEWVSDWTAGRIPELLPAGSIEADTTLVLTNAIYFLASWASPFRPEETSTAPFHALDGDQIDVPMMRQSLEAGYADGTGWAAAELRYAGDQLSMVLLVPEVGYLDSFEASLDGPCVRSILAGLEQRQLTLALPRFTVRSRPNIKEALIALGMEDAFDARADFSGIDGTRFLLVSDVVHEGWVSVDETGTEAAAATGVILARGSMSDPVTLTVDRPFLFLIRDIPTGAILFVGRVVDPSETPA